MKKLFSSVIMLVFALTTYAQQQLNLPMAMALSDICNGRKISNMSLETLGEKYIGQEYKNAIKNNDEFKKINLLRCY